MQKKGKEEIKGGGEGMYEAGEGEGQSIFS